MKINWWYLILTIFGAIAALSAIIQFVMAIFFLELGRMLFYLVVSYLCLILAVFFMKRLIIKNNKSE